MRWYYRVFGPDMTCSIDRKRSCLGRLMIPKHGLHSGSYCLQRLANGRKTTAAKKNADHRLLEPTTAHGIYLVHSQSLTWKWNSPPLWPSENSHPQSGQGTSTMMISRSAPTVKHQTSAPERNLPPRPSSPRHPNSLLRLTFAVTVADVLAGQTAPWCCKKHQPPFGQGKHQASLLEGLGTLCHCVATIKTNNAPNGPKRTRLMRALWQVQLWIHTYSDVRFGPFQVNLTRPNKRRRFGLGTVRCLVRWLRRGAG